MAAKVFKVDNMGVNVFGTQIDGLVEFKPPQAANREKSAVETTEGCVGYSSRIISGETTFSITTMSNQYIWLSSLVDTIQTGTIVFTMPGAVYTMYNAIVSTVEPDTASDGTPGATVTIMYTYVTTDVNAYDE